MSDPSPAAVPSPAPSASDARKPCVAVLFGGRSSEHAISCVTAGSVLEAIDSDTYDVIPTGTTSYRCGSIAARTLPAVTQEIACSLDRPPKTTAMRGLRPRLAGPALGSFIATTLSA